MKKGDRKALKELRSLKDEVILPADKGNAMMVMKRSEYEKRGMLDGTNTYRKLQKDPTATQEARIVRTLQLRNNGEIMKSIYNRIRSSGSCRLPKIHKLQTPLRPIVSCIDAPLYSMHLLFPLWLARLIHTL